MKNLWNKKFKASDITIPKELLDEQCNQLIKLTNTSLVAKTKEYTNLTSLNINAVSKQFHFEMFITSTFTKNYKYRILTISYDLPFFPLYISMDEDIANELGEKIEIVCETEETFLEKLELILNSKKVETVINSLLAIIENEDSHLPF